MTAPASNPGPDGPHTALVTGGARRIGAAIVRDLAQHGWAVAVHCRTSIAEAEQLVGEIRASGGRADAIVADLADLAALRSILPAAAKALGPVTLLVNNASVFLEDAIGGLDSNLWQTQFDINLRAPVFLADAFTAQLPADCEGNIVNMVDQRVLKLRPDMTSYTLSKAALWAATQTLAQALAPRIRVNAIAPGPTFPNWRDGEDGIRREAARLPLKRRVDPAEFGRAIRFIVGARAMTGGMLTLDGGQHLAWRAGES
jgi:NAD(P)-dependent dehydrogenase (short-subunit alcohol dehydrogenase family)